MQDKIIYTGASSSTREDAIYTIAACVPPGGHIDVILGYHSGVEERRRLRRDEWGDLICIPEGYRTRGYRFDAWLLHSVDYVKVLNARPNKRKGE